MTDNEIQSITEIVNHYLNGAFFGDINQIKKAFHPDAHVTGIFNDQLVDWTLSDFINRVTIEPTAANKNEIYDKQILTIDKTSNAAMVKARVKVGDIFFTDYITLLKIKDQWVIRNKSFTT